MNSLPGCASNKIAAMKAALAVFLLAATSAANAAITGTVIGDDGKPLAGVAVRIYAAELPAELAKRIVSAKPERDPIATAQTNDAGVFSIDPKTPLMVEVSVDAPSRQMIDVEAVDGDDLGLLVVQPPTPRSLHVTANGKPVAGARVLARDSVLGKTDTSGDFAWNGAGPAPRYVLHSDYAPQTAFAGFPGSRKAVEIKLAAGVTLRGRVIGAEGPVEHAIVSTALVFAETAADGSFTLSHVNDARMVTARSGNLVGSAHVNGDKPLEIRLAPGAMVAGNVRDSAKGVAGARVMAGSADATLWSFSDAKGSFSVGPLVPGTYSISATHPDYTFETVPQVPLTAGNNARSLSARARAIVRGVVVDEEKKPVAGAYVWSGFGFGVGANAGRTTITNAAGEFAVRAAANGPQNVNNIVAVKRGYAMGSVRSDGSNATVVLPRGFPLKVKVVDASRQGVADARVAAIERSDDGPRSRGASAVCSEPLRTACFTTGDDGSAEFVLTEGSYVLNAAGEGIISRDRAPEKITAKSSPVTIQVDRAVTVAGRVAYSDGSPVADAVVVMRGIGTTPGHSDATGAFTIGVPPGKVTLMAFIQGMSESTSVEVDAPAKNVTLVMPKPARIEGRVTDRATHQPVTDFTVSLQRNDRGNNRPQTVHGDDGSFAIEKVSPGEFTVVVTAAGYQIGRRSGVVAEEGKTASGADLELDRGARVTGHVTAGGQPLAGVAVTRASSRGPQTPAQTDANGDYTLDNLEPGDQTLEFRHRDYLPKRKDVAVEAGKDAHVDMDLDRGRELQGRVVDKSGKPVGGANVSPDSGPGGATSDADGTFKLKALHDGRLSITARKSGYLPANEQVDVPSSTPLVLTLDRGGSITGRVTGVDASEVANVMVSAFGGGVSVNTRADAGGNFTLSGVPDGRVTVNAMMMTGGRRRSAQKIIDVDNGSGNVELELSEGFTVRGRVTTTGGALRGGGVVFSERAAPAGGVMMAGRPRGNGGGGQINADGSYEVNGLALGTYDVRVSVAGGGAIHQTTYNVTGNGTFDIDVRGSGMRGRVVDARSGAPVGEVNITVTGGTQSRTNRNALTDSDGRFSIDLLPPGAYKFMAQRDRYAAARQDVTVPDAAPAEVDVRMEPVQAMIVRTVDAQSGAPVDASVWAAPPGAPSGPPVQAVRGEPGETRLYLAPGEYRLNVNARGYAPQQSNISVPGPEVRLQLMATGRLMVLAHSQRLIRIVSAGAARPAWGPAPPPSNAIESLTPGSYSLEVLDEKRNVVKSYAFVMVAGQTVTVETE
jgi:protocatechuate 3,4-dioxygenase beta subunit